LRNGEVSKSHLPGTGAVTKMEGICLGGFVLIILVIMFAVFVGQAAAKATQEAQQNYHAGLQRLKENPTNAVLRQEVLALGREYSNRTRNQQGITIYDEVALKNDIDAACAGAVAIQKPTASAQERLTALKGLFADSLIDEAEYKRQRQCIIDGV
jgi:hypothetical protein